MKDRIDVLVVGAGPTGLTLSCDLQRRGVRIRVVSAADRGFEGSRAKGIQPRTVEVFDDLGVLADLEQHAMLYPKLGLHLGALTIHRTLISHHEPTEQVPFANTLLAAQSETDASVAHRLRELGGTVEYATRLVSYEQDGNGIVATVEGPSGVERIDARFLVGADGGSSAVRVVAGIDFVGSTDETDRMIVADVTLTGLSRTLWHIWPRRKGRFMALCPLPDGEKFQLMLKLPPDGAADLQRDAINRQVQELAGTKLTVQQVHWSSVWRPNIRLAERYRSGNVFLAGDAAHVHPPTGAQGLNTGVQDAYNLGWKLAQVLSGAPEALLDTYEAERQPVAARVLGLSTELYARMSNRPLGGTTRGDEERQLELNYRGGPLASTSDPKRTAIAAGDRAPDALYADDAGQPGRLFDAFRGPQFTLIAVHPAAIDGLSSIKWPRAGAPLRTVSIVAESAPGLVRAYGIDQPTQILVRPDGYVAYVAYDDWNASLHKQAHLMLPPA
jgi:2-polyprenyl-6-methoxyphenol hydroxylase-like FAD-dependent oxidoreductase